MCLVEKPMTSDYARTMEWSEENMAKKKKKKKTAPKKISRKVKAGKSTKHCGHCGKSGHNRRTCSKV